MIIGHGDDAYRFDRTIRANFSSNVYGHVDLTPLKEHLTARMAVISNYPEPEPYTLEAALAERLGIAADNVCVTAGATEAIYLIAHAFCGSRSDILQPTFSEYGDACRLYGHEIIGDEQDGTMQDLAVIPRATDGHSAKSGDHKENVSIQPAFEDTDLFWICNPNNPDGYVMPKYVLTSIIESHPDTVFVIDQSYGFFTREELLTPAEAVCYPNVLQLHSMTKRYAMPGLRLGYICGPAELLDKIRAVRMPWSVNALAIEAGLYLTEHPDTAPIDLDALLDETRRLADCLNAIPGISAEPGQTHFFLCRLTEGRASELKDWLAREKGLLIRDASNFEGLDEHCFRIATQTPEQNDMLVKAISRWQEVRR